MRILKYIFYFLLAAFILIQFYPKPEKNIATTASSNDISTAVQMDESIKNILQKSCYDCHSDNTKYPWYSNMQPVAMWLGDHINEGKKELNFSQFGTYAEKKKDKKFKEIAEQVEENEMPLTSYTFIHRDAKLSAEEKSLLINWANTNRTPSSKNED